MYIINKSFFTNILYIYFSQSEPASEEFVESVDKQSKSGLSRYKLPVDETFRSYVKDARLNIKRSLSAEEQAQELAW